MPAACRDAVRAVATELLANRRAAMTARAQAEVDAGGSPYTRIALGPAVESAILDLEWAFWQYEGVDACGAVPPPTASDAALWSFLDRVSPVSFSADADTEAYEAYFFQAYRELGSPGTARVRGDSLPPHLAALTQYAEADYVGTLPVGVPVPTHDPAVMADVDAWLQAEVQRHRAVAQAGGRERDRRVDAAPVGVAEVDVLAAEAGDRGVGAGDHRRRVDAGRLAAAARERAGDEEERRGDEAHAPPYRSARAAG